MLRPILLVSVLLTLTGCATETQKQVLQNLEGCSRTYKGAVQGGVLGGGFIGSVDITCNPKPAEGVIPTPPS